MRSLSTYIEFLLMTQHYVFVPGLGGFMFADTEAQFEKSTNHIRAPRRKVQFNRFMTHDDGQLANILMNDARLSYDEAIARIHTEVTQMLNLAQRDGKCNLGHLGQIFFDKECHVSFLPSETPDTDPMHFGLEDIVFKPWALLETEKKKAQKTASAPVVEMNPRQRQDDVIIVPRYWLHRAAIALLVVCLTFANFLPLSRLDKGQLASMVDTNSIISHLSTLESQSWDSEWEDDALLPSLEMANESNATENYAVADLVAEPTIVANIETATLTSSEIVVSDPTVEATKPTGEAAPSTKSEKKYFIIIASCPSREEAEISVKRFNNKGYNEVGILESDGRFRLFINSFDERKIAESQLALLRENSLFTKAWLLPMRTSLLSASMVTYPVDASLSLIIKEKDNAKFTMELSHPNPPAERDQG